MDLLIGLSYADTREERYNYYQEALQRAAARLEFTIETVDLFVHPARIRDIDAILFTGGPDIAPARYGKPEEEAFCGEIDEARDTAEWELAEFAEARALPTLGICRGTQLLNVVHGGTLVTDIEKFGGANHKKIDSADRIHSVHLEPNSFLKKLFRKSDGEVNSSHHQAVERVGEGLIVAARAEDGTVEAIELADAPDRAFWLAVQWHPERLKDDTGFGLQIFETFLLEAMTWKTLKSRIEKHSTKSAD
jgi:putative glutamine amidotransferase